MQGRRKRRGRTVNKPLSPSLHPIFYYLAGDMVSKEEKEGRKERYLQKEQEPSVNFFLVQTIILI